MKRRQPIQRMDRRLFPRNYITRATSFRDNYCQNHVLSTIIRLSLNKHVFINPSEATICVNLYWCVVSVSDPSE